MFPGCINNWSESQWEDMTEMQQDHSGDPAWCEYLQVPHWSFHCESEVTEFFSVDVVELSALKLGSFDLSLFLIYGCCYTVARSAPEHDSTILLLTCWCHKNEERNSTKALCAVNIAQLKGEVDDFQTSSFFFCFEQNLFFFKQKMLQKTTQKNWSEKSLN